MSRKKYFLRSEVCMKPCTNAKHINGAAIRPISFRIIQPMASGANNTDAIWSRIIDSTARYLIL